MCHVIMKGKSVVQGTMGDTCALRVTHKKSIFCLGIAKGPCQAHVKRMTAIHAACEWRVHVHHMAPSHHNIRSTWGSMT